MPRIVVTFTDLDYATKNFHILLPDTQNVRQYNYFWYKLGVYNTISKDYYSNIAGRYYRHYNDWTSSVTTYTALTADVVGKAGSYKDNLTVTVYNPSGYMSTGSSSFLCMSTQWSFF